MISKIGLGMAAIGRPGYINLGHHDDLPNKSKDAMEKQAHALLDRAWDLGIRYFDMARSYGLAEKFMSSWLDKKQPSKNDLIIASKWGYVYTADWKIEAENHEIKYHTIDNYLDQIKLTRELLGDYLTTYQIHSATLESGVLDNKEVLQAMAKLKSNGIKVGLSLSGPKQPETLQKAMAVKVDGVALFDVVQVTYNILEQSVAPYLETLGNNVHVVIKEAMANGRLASLDHAWMDQEKANTLRDLCQQLELSPDQLAMAFITHQPFVNTCLSGAARLDHLESNVQSAFINLPDDVLSAVKNLAESPEKYWQSRGSLQWN